MQIRVSLVFYPSVLEQTERICILGFSRIRNKVLVQTSSESPYFLSSDRNGAAPQIHRANVSVPRIDPRNSNCSTSSSAGGILLLTCGQKSTMYCSFYRASVLRLISTSLFASLTVFTLSHGNMLIKLSDISQLSSGVEPFNSISRGNCAGGVGECLREEYLRRVEPLFSCWSRPRSSVACESSLLTSSDTYSLFGSVPDGAIHESEVSRNLDRI